MATESWPIRVKDRRGNVSSPASLTFDFLAAVPETLWGASAGDNAKFDALNAVAGPLQCRRTYDTGIPATFAASRAVSDVAAGRRSYWSCKPTPASFASGANDAAWLAFLRSVPVGHQFTAILWHEPEDNIAAGQFTLASWKAMINRAGSLLHGLNRPELRMAICFMGPWTFDTRSPYATTDYWDTGFAQNVDVICHDIYRWNPNDPSMQSQMTVGNSGLGGSGQTAMGWAQAKGKPVAVAEWGCTETNVTQASKAGWIAAAGAWMNSTPSVEAAVYFHNNQFVGTEPRSTWEVHDQPLTVFSGLCAEARS